MAREINGRSLKPVLDAAQHWINDCLVSDGSIFSTEKLWTAENIEEVRKAFVDHPDEGEDSFMEKLKNQMKHASVAAKRLVAEMNYVLLLFPSNIKPATKRNQVQEFWSLSGENLPESKPMLSNETLSGIGSGGTAYNQYRPEELAYLIALVGSIKSREEVARQKLFSSYDEFTAWIEKVPRDGDRQFKHMLRYFAFPDRVERMSSNNHRQEILAKCGIASEKETKKWDDRQLDDALFQLRTKLQAKHPNQILDFYEDPIKRLWITEKATDLDPQVLHDKLPPNALANPFNLFFTSFEEAQWAFEFLRSTLLKLGVNRADIDNDRRIWMTLSERSGEGIRLRLNFGDWAILTFLNLSVGENRLQYICQLDRLPSSAPLVEQCHHFAEKIEGQTFVLTSCPVANMRNDSSDERVAFEASLALVAQRLKDRKADVWRKGHEPKVLQMVFNAALRDQLLRAGLENVRSSGTDIAFWWLNANPKIWDFRNAPVGTHQTYTAFNQNGRKRRIYEHFQKVKAGDLMLGYVTTPDKEIVGLCEITKPLHTTPEGEVFEFRKIEQFKQPVTWTALQSLPALANCEPLENNQGSLFALTKTEYDTIRELIDAEESEELVSQPQLFTEADALSGLFMDKEQLSGILARLRRKKALILQGPPGVGKTFVAHRIAYALMGQKDESRVSIVQFHPSYGYEDFIQGYRPTKTGTLERRNGVFYEFVRLARNDPSRNWVFIIDEINRGNLAKIFGELLMLIEADKRGLEHQVALTYSEKDERFYLPENVYVIGTMNTADRSLALVDYALRRRFAFETLEPAIHSPAFSDWLIQKGATKAVTDKIKARIGVLNQTIDKERDLGERYRIGHSFFCPANGDVPNDAWYREIIHSEIKPLLHEYFDSSERLQSLVDELLK